MYYYIVNPAAGGAKINKIQDRLQERLGKLGIMGEFVKSTGPDDVGKLARIGLEKGYKTIVAVGGDGTINEVMNSILGYEKVALGIIPTGTTNDLAESLGIKDWFTATNILAARKVEEINLGKVGNRYFLTSVSVGFDPRANTLKRLSLGKLPERIRFALGMFKHAASFKPIKAHLTFDKNYEVEAECFNISVSSGIFSPVKGKKVNLSKRLDTLVVTKIPGAKALKYGYLADVSAIELPKISVFRSDRIFIDTQKPTEVAADGQIIGETPVEIKTTDEKLRVIVSKKRTR
jgi:YegS/Rv2252/BmrU family lipid kinase